MYQFPLISKLIWPFSIYPFSVSSIQRDFEAVLVRYLKKWLGLNKPANPAILFLPKNRYGLGLTSPVELFKSLQVGALHQLANSQDPMITSLEKCMRERDLRSRSNRWKPAIQLAKAQSIIDFNLAFGGQSNTQGLGFNSKMKLNSTSSLRQKRSAVTSLVRDEEANARIAPLRGLPLSGNFLKWDDLAPSAKSWHNRIYSMSEAELKFVLNAQAQSLPSPANLRRWGCNVYARCLLCSKPSATAKHTLNGCSVAFRQGRYVWRHDNVLKVMAQHLRGLVARANRSSPPPSERTIPFVPAGGRPRPKRRTTERINRLSRATDWRIAIDLDNNLLFPPATGVTTAQRPDIVIWSVDTKTIIWGELTCPLEELMREAHIRRKPATLNWKLSAW
jgi:hypothetical protein